MSAPSYVGTVRSFNPHKGWGFVECDDTHKVYGSDVFLLKNDLNGFGVNKGDQVSFNVTQTEKGARATNVKVLTVGPDGLQSFFGELKSFNPNKGFGFIASPATESIFGKDCFVLSTEFGDAYPEQGMHVQFKAKNGERGPMAVDVRILDPPGGKRAASALVPWVPFSGKGFFGGKGGFGGYGGGFGGKGSFGGNFGGGKGSYGPAQPNENDVFFGTIKNVNERGFAHISCDAIQKIYGKDMFAHRTSVEESNAKPGQSVSFSVSPGPKGPHAVKIQPFDPSSTSMVFTGTVRTFNETKGWGFIESPAAKPIFHSDIFLHRNELNGKSVAVGDSVKFTVDTSAGRASAKNVNTGA
jgi:cold shock protein